MHINQVLLRTGSLTKSLQREISLIDSNIENVWPIITFENEEIFVCV